VAVRPHRETEIKLRVYDVAAIVTKLERLHALCLGRVRERNTLFDTPDGGIRRRGCLLRIRVDSPAASRLVPGGLGRAWLTWKAPANAGMDSRYKIKLETELRVDPATNWLAAFGPIGLQSGFRYEKFRTSFRLVREPGVHLELDETPVGTFLEIEGPPRRIDRAARSLGFSPRDYIRATYWDLYAAHCRRHRRTPRNMLFRA